MRTYTLLQKSNYGFSIVIGNVLSFHDASDVLTENAPINEFLNGSILKEKVCIQVSYIWTTRPMLIVNRKTLNITLKISRKKIPSVKCV